jgi:hypothetical protein
MIALVARKLADRIKEKGLDVTVEALQVEVDPFKYV